MSKISEGKMKNSKIVKEFNSNVSLLVKTLEEAATNDIEISNLDRLKKRISLVKSVMGEDEIIRMAAPLLLNVSDEIIGRNENFFLDIDAREKSGELIAADDSLAYDLIDMAKTYYRNAHVEDKDYIYNIICSLLSVSVSYCLQNDSH